MSLIYLYSYKLPVQMVLFDPKVRNNNMPSVNYAVKVYKNNFNTVEFVVRTNDRKPVKLIDCQLMVTIKNVNSDTVVLEKAVKVTDELNGRAQLALTPDNTRNWPVGGYSYNISIKRPNHPGSEFLYVDIDNNATGSFDLYDSVSGTLIPATTLMAHELTPITTDWDEMSLNLISGAIAAHNQVGNDSGLFSIAVYQNQWSGTFGVQGSLSNLAPTDRSWFDITFADGTTSFLFDGTIVSPTPFNFAINTRWIRFVFVPSLDTKSLWPSMASQVTGVGADYDTHGDEWMENKPGTITKIIYKLS